MKRCWILASMLAVAAGNAAAQDAQELQKLFRQEREQVIKDGSAKRFLPVLLERADELARKGDSALGEGGQAQAREAFRQARWQLPYQPADFPEHVGRVLGNLRLRHGRRIDGVAISPDGRLLATIGADALVKLWDLGNGREVRSYLGHTSGSAPVPAAVPVLFTPDGKHVVSAGAEKDVKIFETATGEETATITVPGQSVSALAVSPDGKHLFVGASQAPAAGAAQNLASLCVYDLPGGRLRRADNNFRGRIASIACNGAGTIVAVADETSQVHLWQISALLEEGKLPAYWVQQDANGNAAEAVLFSPDDQYLVRCAQADIKFYSVPTPGAEFKAAAPKRIIALPCAQHSALFTKDGKTLFTGGSDGIIRFWDPETTQKIGEFQGHNGKAWSLALHPAGDVLASASDEDHVVRLWDFAIVQQARDLAGHTGPVWTAVFSPDGRQVLSSGGDRSLKVWDIATGKATLDLDGQPAAPTVALYRPDGKVIASAGTDKLIRFWDAATGKPLHSGTGHEATVTALDFSPDGRRVVSGGADRSVRLWDADTGQPLAVEKLASVVAAVAFHPDGKQFAVGCIDRTIALHDAGSGKQLKRWPAHGDAVTSLAFSRDGHQLASGGADGAVQVWPLAAPGSNPIRLSGHEGPVSAVAFRADNQHLVSAASDQLVKLWKLEAASGKEVQTFRGHKDWVTSAAFSRDGYRIVSASVDKLVKVWEITSRDVPLQPEHTGAVEALAVSPDSKVVATGAGDRTIKLWDRATGAEVATLAGHLDAVLGLVFSPDGKLLVSSGLEASIRLWEMSPPRELARTAPQLQVFNRLNRYSRYIFMAPDGRKLFIWLWPDHLNKLASKVECYDLVEGRALFSFSDDNRKVTSLAFCANGKLAATGAEDGSVRLYDLAKDGTVLAGGDWFCYDKAEVADLALTPDGKTLVVTSSQGEVQIADIASRQVARRLKAHPGKIMACITSPDGKRFATLGLDNILKLWDLDHGTELRRWVLGRAAGEHGGLALNNLMFTADGRHLVTANVNTTAYVLDLP